MMCRPSRHNVANDLSLHWPRETRFREKFMATWSKIANNARDIHRHDRKLCPVQKSTRSAEKTRFYLPGMLAVTSASGFPQQTLGKK